MTAPREAEHRAIRMAVALSEADHVAAVRVRGPAAFDALDRLVPARLHLRDGQMLHTLLLHPSGHPVADVYVCCDDEDFFLLAEGLSASEVIEVAAEHLGPGLDVAFEDLSATHRMLSLDGPWAWEALAEWLGPDVIGIPYLTFFHLGGRDLGVDKGSAELPGICFRGGTTGEYGYDILIGRSLHDPVRERLLEVGASFDLVAAGLESLDQCAIENGFFCIRAGRLEGLTPIELQLQWRVSYRKDGYVGAEALRRRRSEGARVRLTTFVSSAGLSPGDEVRFEGRVIGEVWACGSSPLRGDWVGQALLERRLAHAGIDVFTASDDDVPLRTVSAPVFDNRSLFVDPRRHCYSYRADEVFPPLVRRV
jgi:aminomethyltransferase